MFLSKLKIQVDSFQALLHQISQTDPTISNKICEISRNKPTRWDCQSIVFLQNHIYPSKGNKVKRWVALHSDKNNDSMAGCSNIAHQPHNMTHQHTCVLCHRVLIKYLVEIVPRCFGHQRKSWTPMTPQNKPVEHVQRFILWHCLTKLDIVVR